MLILQLPQRLGYSSLPPSLSAFPWFCLALCLYQSISLYPPSSLAHSSAASFACSLFLLALSLSVHLRLLHFQYYSCSDFLVSSQSLLLCPSLCFILRSLSFFCFFSLSLSLSVHSLSPSLSLRLFNCHFHALHSPSISLL